MIEFKKYPPQEKGDVVWSKTGLEKLSKLSEGLQYEPSHSSYQYTGTNSDGERMYVDLVPVFDTTFSTMVETALYTVIDSMPDAGPEETHSVLTGLQPPKSEEQSRAFHSMRYSVGQVMKEAFAISATP